MAKRKRTVSVTPRTNAQTETAEGTPLPLQSVLGSARRIVSSQLDTYRARSSNVSNDDRAWQQQAWDMYDLVGEQHFLTNVLANKGAQARLFVGRIDPENLTSEPAESEDPQLNAILDSFGSGPLGRSQLLKRLYLNLYITGECFLVGMPPFQRTDEIIVDEEYDLEDVEWSVLSVDEVTKGVGTVTLTLPQYEGRIEVNPDHLYFLRAWNPHPRWAHRADCPTKASLPVLNEIVNLTMYISAQTRSRLAGAGMIVIPQSAVTTSPVGSTADPNAADDEFVQALIEVMMTPLEDPDNPSAVVPLVLKVADEAVGKIQHLLFGGQLDNNARGLRTDSMVRLATAQDAPPELMTGTGGMNHWGGWLVKEETVTTHIEPNLALICDALTTQFLWPLLQEVLGMDEDEALQYVIWYDVAHLRTKPNLTTDALELHSRGVLSDTALTRILGFNDEEGGELGLAESIALRMVRARPELLQSPGLGNLVVLLRALFDGSGDTVAPVEVAPAQSSRFPTSEQAGEGSPVAGGDGGVGLIPDTSNEAPEIPTEGGA